MVGFNLSGLKISSPSKVFTFHYGRIQSRYPRDRSMRLPYLHSIMVGFNRSTVVRAGWRIQFTFHYGRIQSFCACTPFASACIYIPLWSDSIEVCELSSCFACGFTFHYGRIQSRNSSASAHSLSIFTFHYGRIQSVALAYTYACVVDLHSIMVGFNPDALLPASLPAETFTFHYGRIQSVKVFNLLHL